MKRELAGEILNRLASGEESAVLWRAKQPASIESWDQFSAESTPKTARRAAGQLPGVLSGSFNPVHAGHREMAQRAKASLGLPVYFELSVANADKPSLSGDELSNRCRSFESSDTVIITRAPTFEEKFRHLGMRLFVVGVDTLIRICQPHFYSQGQRQLDRLLDEFISEQVQFVVFGRVVQGEFWDPRQLPIDPRLRSCCHEFGEKEFRMDISSTAIRRSGRGE